MIELHTWKTPNGYKPIILLEELAMPYRIVPVDLGKKEQKSPEYLRINPNGKIPAIIDPEGDGGAVRVFESGAILVYLAEKAGRFLPTKGAARAETMAWLMFQMSAVGPMFGQLGHFRDVDPPNPGAVERFRAEVDRILGVLEDGLHEREYLAGEYSIADMATVTWAHALDRLKVDISSRPRLSAWRERVLARDAVKKALAWKP